MVQQSLAATATHSHTAINEDEANEHEANADEEGGEPKNHLEAAEAETGNTGDEDEVLTIHVFGAMMAQELCRTAQALSDKHVSTCLCECIRICVSASVFVNILMSLCDHSRNKDRRRNL